MLVIALRIALPSLFDFIVLWVKEFKHFGGLGIRCDYPESSLTLSIAYAFDSPFDLCYRSCACLNGLYVYLGGPDYLTKEALPGLLNTQGHTEVQLEIFLFENSF